MNNNKKSNTVGVNYKKILTLLESQYPNAAGVKTIKDYIIEIRHQERRK